METKLSAEHPWVTNSVEFIQGLKDKLFPDPFAAEKAVIKENREGQIGGEITKRENWLGPVIKDAATDVLTQVAVGSALKGTTSSTVPKLSPSQHKTINVTPGGPIVKTPNPRSLAVLTKLKKKITGPYKPWQTQAVPFGQTSPNITSEVYDAALRTGATATLDPNGLQNWGKNKRKSGAKFATGKSIQDESSFIQAGWQVFAKISNNFGIDINRATSPLQIHHKGVVRQIAESLNGLTEEAAVEGGNLISEKVGFKLGYDKENAAPVPAKFHQRVHDIINDHISLRWGDNLKGLEEKLNLPSNWKTTMDLQARIDAGIYDEIAAGINESTAAIDTFWKSLSARTNLGKLTKDEFLDVTLEVVELDKRLSTLQRTRHLSPEEGYTATQAVNEILERAGRIDLQSPIFDKLDPEMSKDLIKILIQRNGEKALREVIVTGQDPETVFEAYGIETKGYDKLFNQLTLPGFTDIKDPFAGKPLGRPKGSKDTVPRKKVTRDKKTKPKTDKRSRRKYPETGEGLDEFGNPL